MPSAILIEKLYAEIVLGCEEVNCDGVFVSSQLARQPVAAWAIRAAEEAESQGWSASETGKALCPKCSQAKHV